MVKAHGEAEAALADLREAVRGIHPRVLVDHGLEAAVREVADRSPLPVSVGSPATAVPAPIEAAAYFVVSEALGNVAKHAAGEPLRGERWVRDRMVVTITDDGIGGAGEGRRHRTDRAGDPVGRLGRHTRPVQPTRWADRLRMECPCQALSIVLAEDSLLLREGLASILDRAGHEVARPSATPTPCLPSRKEPPDVVITDVRMPPGHSDEGLRAAAGIRAELPGDRDPGAVPVRRRRLPPSCWRQRPGDRLPAQGPGRARREFLAAWTGWPRAGRSSTRRWFASCSPGGATTGRWRSDRASSKYSP